MQAKQMLNEVGVNPSQTGEEGAGGNGESF